MTEATLADAFAATGMLIRRPPAEVYGALIDPEVTTRFWLDREREMYGVGKRIAS